MERTSISHPHPCLPESTRPQPEGLVGWGRLLFFLVLFFVGIELASYHNIALISYGLLAAGAMLLIVNLQLGVLFYFATLLLSTDTPYTLNTTGFSSVHTTAIAGLSVMNMWTLFLLAVCGAYIVISRRRHPVERQRLDRLVVALAIPFALAAVIGLKNLDDNLRIYIHDASYYGNLAIAYLAVRLTCQDRRWLYRLVSVLVVSITVFALAGVVYYVVGIGQFAGSNVRAVWDSSRNLFPILVLLGLACYLLGPRIPESTRAVLFIGTVAGAFNVISYASRGNLILLSLGVLLLLFLNKTRYGASIDFRQVVKVALIVGMLTVLILWAMAQLRPGSLNYVYWKLVSTVDLEYDQDISSAATRWLEWKNINAHLLRNGTIILGEGLAGWFTDSYYPFALSLLGGSAYPDDWILSGRLYKPHGTQLFILLKMGIGGLVFYHGILTLIFLEGIRILRRSRSDYASCIALAIVAFMPLLFYKAFSSKMQLFMGALIAILAVINSLDAGPRSEEAKDIAVQS